nr:MAG TPA: hypothetical protein [Caudoviricetes sp.]
MIYTNIVMSETNTKLIRKPLKYLFDTFIIACFLSLVNEKN